MISWWGSFALGAEAVLPPLGTLPVGQSRDGANDIALIVTIDDYLALDDVPGAAANGDEWEAYLLARGVPADHVVRLSREAAIAPNIEATAAELARERGAGGRAWFVWVGHGTSVRVPGGKARSALVAYNAVLHELSLADDSVSPDVVLDAMTQGRADVPVVAVVDACFAGGVKLPGAMTVVPEDEWAAPSYTVLLASRAEQIAGALPGVRRPAFSWLVLAGLRGGADGAIPGAAADGRITGAELVKFAGTELDSLTTHAQDPTGAGLEVVVGTGREPRPDLRRALADAGEKCLSGAEAAAQAEGARRLAADKAGLLGGVRAEWASRGPRYERCAGSASATEKAQCAAELRAWVTATGALEARVAPVEWTAPANGGCGPAKVLLPALREAARPPELAAAQATLARLEATPPDDDGYTHPVLGELRKIPGKDYWMMKTEVTQRMWKQVMGGANPSNFPDCDDCPVENVSASDAEKFARLVSGDGEPMRLPTEEEWEYAARGGEAYEYAGSNSVAVVAWYGENSGGETHPVCTRKPNGYGLCDMSGNVWEWTSTEEGSNRVIRGGSWNFAPAYARVAYRFRLSPDDRNLRVGFRLARSSP